MPLLVKCVVCGELRPAHFFVDDGRALADKCSICSDTSETTRIYETQYKIQWLPFVDEYVLEDLGDCELFSIDH